VDEQFHLQTQISKFELEVWREGDDNEVVRTNGSREDCVSFP
jgi:hypothetical protein